MMYHQICLYFYVLHCRRMLYNLNCLHFLLGIPKLYTAGLLLCLLRINMIKVFLSPSKFESFEGTKFVFMYGKSFKKEENLYVYA